MILQVYDGEILGWHGLAVFTHSLVVSYPYVSEALLHVLERMEYEPKYHWFVTVSNLSSGTEENELTNKSC